MQNDRQHAAHIDLNGHVGGLTAVHFAAHNALGVLNGQAAL